jgi:GGDEF domain-containing protein
MNNLTVRLGINNPFFERVGLELKRAERYRLFVSLIVLDLSSISSVNRDQSPQPLVDLVQVVRENIRVIDNVSVLTNQRLALLLPETSRQGAEIAARRLIELIRNSLMQHTSGRIDDTIPLEMVSYPDAAGAKTVTDFLQELSEQSRN